MIDIIFYMLSGESETWRTLIRYKQNSTWPKAILKYVRSKLK